MIRCSVFESLVGCVLQFLCVSEMWQYSSGNWSLRQMNLLWCLLFPAESIVLLSLVLTAGI